MKYLTHSLLLLVVLLALPIRAQEIPVNERYTGDGLYHIVGPSYDAVQFTAQMAERMSRLARQYLPVPKAPPQPVLIKLIPAEKADFTAPYHIRPQIGGGVYVLVRWGADTRFEDLAQALASGLLQRTAIWHYGPEAAAQVPVWFQLAFGQELVTDIRPAAIDQQRTRALEKPPRPLSELLTATGPFGADLPEISVDSGWLFRFLSAQSKTRAAFRRVCSAFLAGMNPNAILVKGYPDQFENPREMELWWLVGFEATVRGRQGPFASPEESRHLLTSMAFITFEADDEDIRVAGQTLWNWHENPEARLAMEQRVREVKIEIQKVNPIYFNSMLSLGLLYEAALGEDPANFAQALAYFALDFQKGQMLELDIKRLLRW